MGRFSRGGTLTNVHIRTSVLLCVLAVLLAPSSAKALSVEPVIDSVLSIAKLDDTGDSASNSRPNAGKSTDKASASPSLSGKSSDTVVQPPSSNNGVSEPAMATQPIDQLPVIDTVATQPQTISMYRPVPTLAASHAVLGVATSDDVAPLQTSRHGWQIFGITWYWWLAAGIIIYCVIRRTAAIRYRQNMTTREMV